MPPDPRNVLTIPAPPPSQPPPPAFMVGGQPGDQPARAPMEEVDQPRDDDAT